jgi:hypothetical protein
VKRIKAIEQVGRAMSDLMPPAEVLIASSDPEVERMAKIDVFVHARRCSKCREDDE